MSASRGWDAFLAVLTGATLTYAAIAVPEFRDGLQYFARPSQACPNGR